MPPSRGEHLLRSLEVSGPPAAVAELRGYLRRLEQVGELANRMYRHELALRKYHRGDYRSCSRCAHTFWAPKAEEMCPYCIYPEVRPDSHWADRFTVHEAA